MAGRGAVVVGGTRGVGFAVTELCGHRGSGRRVNPQGTSEAFRDLLDAHLGTVFETCRAAAPRMVAQGGGSIVNTSSFAFLGDYGGTGYPAGKGGVTSLTMALAAELKEHGVRANVVCPGAKTSCRPGRGTRLTSRR